MVTDPVADRPAGTAGAPAALTTLLPYGFAVAQWVDTAGRHPALMMIGLPLISGHSGTVVPNRPEKDGDSREWLSGSLPFRNPAFDSN
jgi:hypothetical protein